MFTGDRSGDWLYRALHRAGFASQAESRERDDGMVLDGVLVTAAVRCAPPANRPSPVERNRCAHWLRAEFDAMEAVKVIVALGSLAYNQTCRLLEERGHSIPRPRPKFGHGLEVDLGAGLHLLCSYHPSQQNTFTGKLTEPMFDAVWARARVLAGGTTRRVDARATAP
jgi:uracil-DNA glycosylase